MDGITFVNYFLHNSNDLFLFLTNNVEWDERMLARKTASFGVAYNYSQIDYPYKEMLPELKKICRDLYSQIGFEPNNCLINFYSGGSSKMGYHSDQTDILESDTGIAIVSLGETRVLRFRSIQDKEEILDFELPSGSLIYMTQAVQSKWQHCVPEATTGKARMSLTFRRIKTGK